MLIDPSMVESIVTTTSFRADVVEQILYLKLLLKKISEDPQLSRHFVLIGGTAINLFDRDIPRLSVDIDLDYVLRVKAFDPIIIEKHLDTLSRIGTTNGMKVYDDRDRKEKSLEKLRMIFEFKSNFSRDTGTVKIDISYLMKEMIYPPHRLKMRPLTNKDVFTDLNFLVADQCELWAGKAVALVYKSSKDRKPAEVSDLYSMQIARHLFDVSRMQQRLQNRSVLISKGRLRKAFILKGVVRQDDLYLLSGDGLRNCSEHQIKTELDPYLPQSEKNEKPDNRPSLSEMKKNAKEFLHNVCSNAWTKREKKFVEEFQEEGNYKPELLFPTYSREYNSLVNNSYLLRCAEENRKKLSVSV